MPAFVAAAITACHQHIVISQPSADKAGYSTATDELGIIRVCHNYKNTLTARWEQAQRLQSTHRHDTISSFRSDCALASVTGVAVCVATIHASSPKRALD